MKISLPLFVCLLGCESNGAPQSGFQIETPAFVVAPGVEAWKCYYTSAPADAEVAIARLRSRVARGSHHFTLYTTATPLRPDGTFEDCATFLGLGGDPSSAPVWLYSSRDPTGVLEVPPGVALPLAAHQPLLFNLHYLNTTSAPMTAKVTVSFEAASGPYQKAGALVTFNTEIAVPPGGTQTVEGHCAPPPGVHFFAMSTHSHKFTTMAAVYRWSDDVIGAQLVATTDWAHPTVAKWEAPYLTLDPGEEIYYRCAYANDTAQTITVGESADSNEMCMAIGYYFPADGNTTCIDD